MSSLTQKNIRRVVVISGLRLCKHKDRCKKCHAMKPFVVGQGYYGCVDCYWDKRKEK